MNRSIINYQFFVIAVTVAVTCFLLQSCVSEGQGFSLPEGNVEDGKVAFMDLGCNVCHEIADIERIGTEDDMSIPLGGETTRVKTYGELVTSIINPSHKISAKHVKLGGGDVGDSRMVIFNEIMTVQQLVDIVTFLEGEYEVTPKYRDQYPYYY